jgi:hypothetical protein
MNYVQDIIRTDPNTPMKSGRLWLRKTEKGFLAFGPNEKRELLFGVFAAVILSWIASVI